MKLTKKNVLAIGGAVMMTACLATAVSASSLPENAPANDVGVASIQAVDVDLSAIDWTNVQEGELMVVGAIDPDELPCTLSTESLPADAAACLSAVEVVDFDPSTIDSTEMLEGTPIPVGTVDPGSFSGTTTTQGK